MKDRKKDERVRTWVFIAYPESMPENWRDILAELGVPWACSPLHDEDVYDGGEKKKPHYHFVLSFSGPKSFDQVKEITDKLNAPIPDKCHSVRGAVRYFLHLDSPEKFNYSSRRNEIQAGGGFDVEDALKLSSSEEEEIAQNIESVIYEKCVMEYVDLAYWVRKYHPEWRKVLKTNSYHFTQIMKSLRHGRHIVDIETGEVVYGES
jgi:hypothetical protein